MIRLRRSVERAVRHRWFGPLILLVLVVLLTFVALHAILDVADAEAGILLMCVALVALLTRVVLGMGPVVERDRVRLPGWRAPPVGTRRASRRLDLSVEPPLRL